MTALLKEKADELHRVRTLPFPPARLGLTHRWLCFSLCVCCIGMNASLRFAQLADALVEHETLDAEEVQKVIKGERIRNIDEVIQEDLSRLKDDEETS